MESSNDVSMYFAFPLNRCWNGHKIQSCGPKSAYVVSCNSQRNLKPIHFPNCKKTDQDDDDDTYYGDDFQSPQIDDDGSTSMTSWDDLLNDDYGSVNHATVFTSLTIELSNSSEYTLMSAELWLSPSSHYQDPMVTDIASCVAQLCHIFTHNGSFEVRGNADAVPFPPRLAQPIPEDFSIQSTIIKDTECNDHFFTIANSSNGAIFNWNSVPDQVTFVFDCNSKVIYGPTSSTPSQICAVEDTYDVHIGIQNGLAYFNDSICGNLSLAIHFPGPYYLYMSADFDQWRDISDDELTGSDRMYCTDSSQDYQCGIIGNEVKACGGTNYAQKNGKSCPFQVCGGQRATIDLSICVGDTYMRLFNAAGALINFNDDTDNYNDDDTYDDDGDASLCSYLEFALPVGTPCEDLTLVMGCYDDDSCTGILNITVREDTDVITSITLEDIDYLNWTGNFSFICPNVTQMPGQVDTCSFEICAGYSYEVTSRACSLEESQISLVSYDSLDPLDSGICGDSFNFQGFDGCQLVTVYQSCPSSALTPCTVETLVSIATIPQLEISWNHSHYGIGSIPSFTVFGEFPSHQDFSSGLYFVLYSAEVASEVAACNYWDGWFYDYIEVWEEAELPIGLGLFGYNLPLAVSSYGGSYRVIAFYENFDSDWGPHIAGISPDLIIIGEETFDLVINPPVPNEYIIVSWSSTVPVNESFLIELRELSMTGL
jgi:hypothetical protein